MTEYKAKDYETRKALEAQVISDSGKTVEKKDAKITGTMLQLKELGLSHSQSIWGVVAEETNYKVINNPKVKRGNRTRTKINGQ